MGVFFWGGEGGGIFYFLLFVSLDPFVLKSKNISVFPYTFCLLLEQFC